MLRFPVWVKVDNWIIWSVEWGLSYCNCSLFLFCISDSRVVISGMGTNGNGADWWIFSIHFSKSCGLCYSVMSHFCTLNTVCVWHFCHCIVVLHSVRCGVCILQFSSHLAWLHGLDYIYVCGILVLDCLTVL